MLFLFFVFNTRSCNAAEAATSNNFHGNILDPAHNRIPLYSHDSLPQVRIRLQTTLPLGPVETSISLYPTRSSPFTVSKGVAFLPYEWGVWGAEVLDGPFMAKRKEREADRILRRSTPKDSGIVEEKRQRLEEQTLSYENEETGELDDDYKKGEELTCLAAGFQRMKYELDFTLRDSWGAAIWEVECWVPRKSRLKRWWESIWSK